MKPSECFLCSERAAVLVHDGWPLCDRCYQQAIESAAERQLSQYYGSAEPFTVTERSHATGAPR